jgi:hypothetical protein
LKLPVINLFECYLQTNQLNKAIDLFVDSYFFNNHIIDKIETDELLNKIRINKFRNVEKSINLPIFYTVVDADEVETHITFELFNKTCGVEKASELLQKTISFDQEKFACTFLNILVALRC